jgi:hypothetical protein
MSYLSESMNHVLSSSRIIKILKVLVRYDSLISGLLRPGTMKTCKYPKYADAVIGSSCLFATLTCVPCMVCLCDMILGMNLGKYIFEAPLSAAASIVGFVSVCEVTVSRSRICADCIKSKMLVCFEVSPSDCVLSSLDSVSELSLASSPSEVCSPSEACSPSDLSHVLSREFDLERDLDGDVRLPPFLCRLSLDADLMGGGESGAF